MDVDQFLLEDLKIKAEFLQHHFQSMWTRFNFFITVQAGLVVLLFSTGTNGFSNKELYFACVEAFLAFIWWLFAAQDRYLVLHYRNEIKAIAVRIAAIDNRLSYYQYHYVGAPPLEGEKDPEVTKQTKPWNLIEWRLERMSITRLAVIFPLSILFFWLLVIVILLAQKL